MRLLFVTQDFPPDMGGIQTYCWELSARFAQRRGSFHLIAPTRPNDAEIDASRRFPIHRLRTRPDLLGLRALPFVPRLAHEVAFDVAVHVQWQTAFTSFLSRFLTGYPRKIVITLHGRDTVFNPFNIPPLAKGYNALRRTAVSEADLVLPVSQFLAQRARKFGATAEQVKVISNATNPDVFYPDPDPSLRADLGAEDRPLVLSAGRLVPKKGFDTALRAMDQIRETVPDALLLIAGDGPERSSLEKLTRSLDLGNHVHFLGAVPQDELRRYYSTADVFLMAGRQTQGDVEGFGLVFLEANACGTPVVGARVGGVPDAIVDGKTGHLVPPEDPDATASAVSTLLTDPARAASMGEQGRARVLTSLNWDAVADRIYDTLTTL